MTPSFMNMMSSTLARRLPHSLRASLLLGATALSLATAAMVSAADQEKPKDTGGKTVSYYREVVPIFKRSCSGCHHPGKLKGQLDLTSYEAFKKGGKHGPGFVAGKPKDSIIVDEISGSEPSMPKEGDPLEATEIALIQRWILDGANDDTPAGAGWQKLTEAPV